MNLKLRFYITMTASPDPKTGVTVIRTVTLAEQNRTFIFPENYQTIHHHKEIMELPAAKAALKALTKRGAFRNITISLEPELSQLYFDEDLNPIFKGIMLEEEILEPSVNQTPKESSVPESRDILDKITKRFVITRYNNINQNASLWITTFEAECERFKLPIGRRAEALRLFLDDTAADWYSSLIINNSVESEWKFWRDEFLAAFTKRGWEHVAYAFDYQYLSGTLTDFVIKKNKLLLEIDPQFPERQRVDLIVCNFPKYVREKLDRETTNSVRKLLESVKNYETLITTRKQKSPNIEKKFNTSKIGKPTYASPSTTSGAKPRSPTRRSPCPHCLKLGSNRYHPEAVCWYRNTDNQDKNRKVNQIELELDKKINLAQEASKNGE